MLTSGCAQTPQSSLAAAAPPNPEGSRAAVTDLAYQAAVRAIDRREYGQALDLLQSARSRAPDDARILNAFGVVYDKLGRFDLSARYYALAEAADPNSAIVANNIAYSQALQFAAIASPIPAPTALASRPAMASVSKRVLPSPSPAVQAASMAPVGPPAVLAAAAPIHVSPSWSRTPAPTTPSVARPAVTVVAVWTPPSPSADPAVPSAPVSRPAAVAAAAPVRLSPSRSRVPAPTAASVSRPAVPVVAARALPSPDAPPAAPSARVDQPIVAAAAAPVRVLVSPPSVAAQAAPTAQASRSAAIAVSAPVRDWPSPALYPVRWSPAKPADRPAMATASAATRAFPPAERALSARPALTSALAGAAVRLISSDGGPIMLIDATGARRGEGAEPVRLALLHKGWSAHRRAEQQARREAHTTIIYAKANVATARALWRTLPARVSLVACRNNCRGVRLIVGADAASMKFAPRTRRSS